MSSNAARTALALIAAAALTAEGAQRTTPRFLPDDPIALDRDTAVDASGARARELSAVTALMRTFVK